MLRKIFITLGIIILVGLIFYISLILFSPIEFIKTVDHDSNLSSVTLNGHKFHSETFGDTKNQIIIAIHGGPGGDYRSMLSLKELSNKYFIVFYDQRMTGLSSRKSDKEFTVKSFYDDLNSLIDYHYNGKPVHLVGHSWGAMMASGYVAVHPEKVEKIVLIEPGILRPDLAEEFFNQPPPEISFIDFINISKLWLNKWRVNIDNDPYARDDYFKSMMYLYIGNKNGGPEFKGWRMGTYSIDQTIGRSQHDPDFMATLDFITGSDIFDGHVLFLTSEYNKVFGVDYQKKFLGYYQHAEQRIVFDSGHNIFVDQPELSNKMIDDFLSNK
ncbi:MAG: alpha/beta hydrolase [Spirochaetaceae bacterium]